MKYWQIFSSILIFCYYLAVTKKLQNIRNSENISHISLGIVRWQLHINITTVFLPRNLQSFFQIQEKLKTCRESNLIFRDFWKLSFFKWDACNICRVLLNLPTTNSPTNVEPACDHLPTHSSTHRPPTHIRSNHV